MAPSHRQVGATANLRRSHFLIQPECFRASVVTPPQLTPLDAHFRQYSPTNGEDCGEDCGEAIEPTRLGRRNVSTTVRQLFDVG
jgi:hypothetical protein